MSRIPDDPGTWLRTHTAPSGLLEASLESPQPRRQSRGLAIAAGLLVAAAAGFCLGALDVESAPADAPEVAVRLVFYAPDAEQVGVAGTWNRWNPAAHRLLRGPEGVFTATVRLPRGRYEYMFVIDGERWVADPAAAVTREDAFGKRNGVLEV